MNPWSQADFTASEDSGFLPYTTGNGNFFYFTNIISKLSVGAGVIVTFNAQWVPDKVYTLRGIGCKSYKSPITGTVRIAAINQVSITGGTSYFAPMLQGVSGADPQLITPLSTLAHTWLFNINDPDVMIPRRDIVFLPSESYGFQVSVFETFAANDAAGVNLRFVLEQLY